MNSKAPCRVVEEQVELLGRCPEEFEGEGTPGERYLALPPAREFARVAEIFCAHADQGQDQQHERDEQQQGVEPFGLPYAHGLDPERLVTAGR